MELNIKVSGSIRKGKGNFRVDGDAILFKGRNPWNGDAPKTYKKVGVINHSIGNDYNSHLATIYRNAQGIYKYEIYRDGNFYPYFGTIEFNNMIEI